MINFFINLPVPSFKIDGDEHNECGNFRGRYAIIG
jgi:hypothetical protein